MLNTTIYKFLLSVFLGGYMATTGTWNVGGFNLPDFNITERLGFGTPNPLALANMQGTTSGLVGSGGQAFSTPNTTVNSGNTANLSSLFNQQGQVQGTSTQGTGGFSAPQQNTGGQPSQPSQPSFEDQQRSSINSGWDAYTNSLNDQLNSLSGQQQGQNQLAQQTFDSGKAQLGTQQEAGIRDVNSQQASSLKDLGENVRNLFTAGNINLGARGAADSSAANQYSYAIGKMGTKARGDILTQSNSRMNQLKDIYTTETNRLESEKNTRIAQISDWFNSAQSQIKGQIGQAGLNKQRDIQALSTNIYNQALQAMQALQAESSSRRQSLESWATSNAKSIGEVINNMKQIQQMPEFQGIQGGMPTVNSQGQPSMFGYGSQDNTKDIFGLKR